MTKIIYNEEHKDNVINILNKNIDTLKSINNSFDNTQIPNDFYYRNSLNNIIYSIRTISSDLNNYKNSFTDTCSKINKTELELLSKMNKIDDLIINKFE